MNNLDNMEVAESFLSKPEDIKTMIMENKATKVLCQNIRSVNKNMNGLLTLLKRINLQFEIVVLTKCWLSSSGNPPTLDTYTSYATTKLYNQNDGLIMYVKSNKKHTIEEPPFSEANCMVAKFGIDTVVIGIYRPHCFKNDATFFLNLSMTCLFSISHIKT